MGTQIQILHSKEIDPKKWDHCINNSSNSLIYARYHYLTNQCINWSGLVIDDYATVLPLPWKRKWGIRYLYAPAFIQQLGFFGNFYELPISQIIDRIKEFAKFGDLFFNHQNLEIIPHLDYVEKTNYILDLNNSYPKIYSNYAQDLLKNLQKSEKYNLQYLQTVSIENTIEKFQINYQDRFPQFNSKTFQNLKHTCKELAENNQCFTRSIYSETTDQVISTALLLKDNKRLYLLLNSTNLTGRSLSANHFLIDSIIQEFCEEALILDFEGSERKGIKDFYKSFHPINQPYFHYRFNNLPFFINMVRALLNK
jgi:hypothetical protein